jgi:plastocyanin
MRMIGWTRGGKLAVVAALALALPAGAHAGTYDVQVGGGDPAVGIADLQGFYPANAFVHVGDSIDFRFAGFHTVTFLPGAARPHDIAPLPIIQPTGTGTYPIVDDAAGHPFWWSGAFPMLGFNPDVAAPTPGTTVDGTGLVGSGLPTAPSFVVTFTKAGSFAYYCAIHPRMRATVHVLPAAHAIPSQHA